MSTSYFSTTKLKKRIDKFFDSETVTRLSQSSGFIRRFRKITAMDFVVAFLQSCSQQKNTFSQWAFQISLLCGIPVSKQAVFERMGQSSVDFSKSLLEHILLQRICFKRQSTLFRSFGRVILQDSTTLHLPQKLSEVFRGNFSHGKQKAVARIQAVIDLCNMQFLHFSLGSFTDNDQSASPDILGWACRGDLVIRDLGYFVLETFGKLSANGIFFLSRLRFGINMYREDGERIPLEKLLRKKGKKDLWVLIGAKERVRVRLVMIPLPQQQAAERVRKARQDRDRRLNHGEEYYRWLGYTVLITNVKEEVWSDVDMLKAYQVRWHIEIVFKSWKSGFHLQQVLHDGCTNEMRVRTSVYLLLIFICLFMQKILLPAIRYGKQDVSMIKCVQFFVLNIKEMIGLNKRQSRELIHMHCKYEKRTDRTNLNQLFMA